MLIAAPRSAVQAADDAPRFARAQPSPDACRRSPARCGRRRYSPPPTRAARLCVASFIGERAVLRQLLVERGDFRAPALRGEPRGIQLRAQIGLALRVLRIARANLLVAVMFVESSALPAVAREREIAVQTKQRLRPAPRATIVLT